MLDGTITRATYDAADFSDPQVIALMDAVTVYEYPVLAAQMPSLANRVTIRLKDGRVLEEEIGTRANPSIGISDADLETKFRDFASDHFSEARTQRVLDLLWRIDALTDFDELFAAAEIA